MENPWEIQSIYELLYFNCPSCVFKNNSKQEFINHAYKVHPDCVQYLVNVNDNSLNDIFCPWNIIEIKNEPVSYDSVPEHMYDPINIEPHVKIEHKDFDETVNTNKIHKQSATIVGQNKKTYCVHCIDKIDHKIHVCKICNIEFDKINELKKHFNAEHKGENNVSCETCGKSFSKNCLLQTHIKTVHEGIKDFPCETCGQAFARKRNLQRHIEIIHDGIREHKCEWCGKEFSVISHLKNIS